jgi:hypothetical protein
VFTTGRDARVPGEVTRTERKVSAQARAGSKPFFATRVDEGAFCRVTVKTPNFQKSCPQRCPPSTERDRTERDWLLIQVVPCHARFARVRFFFERVKVSPRVARPRAPFETRAFRPPSSTQEDRRLPRRLPRLAERARVLARRVVDAHAVQHPRANRVVTRERDRSPAGAMRASSRSPARLAEARARGARLLAIALCASLPFAALAQTIDAHELNLCGSGTPPSVFLARLGAVPIPGLRTIVFFRLPCL